MRMRLASGMNADLEAKLLRITRGFGAHGVRAPLDSLLTPLRKRATEEILRDLKPQLLRLWPELLGGSRQACEQLTTLGDQALVRMRQRVGELALASGRGARQAAVIDSWWQSQSPEYMDDPALEEQLRCRILEHLDELNEVLGSYQAFFRRVAAMADASGARVLDLAAGNGGFALALARMAADARLPLEIVATDLRSEYLDLGRKRVVGSGLQVRFAVQNALDTSNIEPGHYDIVTCTQSLHHFSGGEVALMITEAFRIAGCGIIFIDGSRSATNAAIICGLSALLFRNGPFVHDTLVSFRRFFVAEELEMLSRLGPFGDFVSTGWDPPGHCVVELTVSAGHGPGTSVMPASQRR